MTDRRDFIGGLALATLAKSCIANAQPVRKIHRIGVLGIGSLANMAGPQPRSSTLNALLRRLRELGYVNGEHFVIEYRGSDGRPERLPALAAELVALQVDVIVGAGPSLPALKQVTSTVPVVMSSTGDPVRLGYVQSLAHPGGNFTGLSSQSLETMGKRLELVKELVPGTAPVAVIWDRAGSLVNWQTTETAARARGWKLVSLEIRGAGDVETAFQAAIDARAGALLVTASGILYPQARRVAELAAKTRLPAMYEQRPYVEVGGLVSYGANLDEIWRHAATFVDKILKGAKPADLPVEQPTKFELVINLKTARALGLTIPQSLLLRVDEVIK